MDVQEKAQESKRELEELRESLPFHYAPKSKKFAPGVYYTMSFGSFVEIIHNEELGHWVVTDTDYNVWNTFETKKEALNSLN